MKETERGMSTRPKDPGIANYEQKNYDQSPEEVKSAGPCAILVFASNGKSTFFKSLWL
jgi:hypothetical protein